MTRALTLVLALATSLSCQAQDRILDVPLVMLIVNPRDFVGSRIETVGYLDASSLSPKLYLSKELADAADFASAIDVGDTEERDITRSNCASSFVRVRGTFREYPEGDFIIEDIVHIRIAKKLTIEMCYETTE